MTERKIMVYFDSKFYGDISSRLRKLNEEVAELNKAEFEANREHFMDEVSDVLAVITHIGHCLGYSSLYLLNKAYEKCKIRETNPGYKH